MAHQIVDEQIAYRGETPWHGLGTQMEDGADPDAFLKAAKLDWRLMRCRLNAEDEDGFTSPVADRFAWVRSSDRKALTIAGPHWRPLQNRDAIDFMARYVKAGGASMETVGGLRDGAVIWGLARINHAFEVRPGDRTEGYLLITSPHEVGSAISIRTTTVRVVCANTLALAERGVATYRQSHMREFDVDAAREAVAGAHEDLAGAEKRARTLDKLKVSVADALRYAILPAFDPVLATDLDRREDAIAGRNKAKLPKSAIQILASIARAPGAIPDTAWGVLNGVTHYCDHVAGRSADARLSGSWLGQSGRRKLQVEKALLELAL